MIGVKEPSNRVPIKGLLLFYGVFDFDTVLQAPLPFIKLYAHSFLGSDPERYTANSQIASPIKHVVPGLPPVFLCAGQRDGLFSQSVAFAEVLDSAGTPYRKLFFGEGVRANHGFLFFKWLKSSRRALSETTEFLEDLVRP